MQISLRCAKCGKIFLQDNEDDLCLSIDFKEMEIMFICRNKSCGYENIMDLKLWKEKSKHSPLPRIGVM